MKQLKLEDLDYTESIYEALEHAKEFRMEYPEYVPMPKKLPNKHTAQEALEYANNLSEYEKLKKDEDDAYAKANVHNNAVDEIIEQWMKEKSGLNDIPEQYRAKVYSLAYQNGHSSGYSEIFGQLTELVDIFK